MNKGKKILVGLLLSLGIGIPLTVHFMELHRVMYAIDNLTFSAVLLSILALYIIDKRSGHFSIIFAILIYIGAFLIENYFR